MVKKIVVVALVMWGLVFVYKNFIAEILEGFFSENKGKVDLYQTSYDENADR